MQAEVKGQESCLRTPGEQRRAPAHVSSVPAFMSSEPRDFSYFPWLHQQLLFDLLRMVKEV